MYQRKRITPTLWKLGGRDNMGDLHWSVGTQIENVRFSRFSSRPSQRLSAEAVQEKRLFTILGGLHMTLFEWVTTLVSVATLVVQTLGILKEKKQDK